MYQKIKKLTKKNLHASKISFLFMFNKKWDELNNVAPIL